MNTEAILQAKSDAEFLVKHLQRANEIAPPLLHLALMPMIEHAVKLQQQIDALHDAVNAE